MLLIITGEHCIRLRVEGGLLKSEEVQELQSTQEEADTRIFLHAQHASTSDHEQVKIITILLYIKRTMELKKYASK